MARANSSNNSAVDRRGGLRGRQIQIALVLVTMLALGIRYTDLGEAPFWRDEAFRAHLLTRSPGEVLRALQADVHAPAFDVLLRFWSYAAGTSEAGLRSLGATLGGLTPAALYWAVVPAVGPAGALAGATILAVNPGHILYSQELSVYSLLVLLATAMLGVYLRIGAGRAMIGWLALVLAAQFYTHLWSLQVWLALAVAATLTALMRRNDPAARTTRRRTMAALIVAAVLASPWAIVAWRQARSASMEHLPTTPSIAGIFVETGWFWFHSVPGMCAAAGGLVAFILLSALRGRSAISSGAIAFIALLMLPHAVCLGVAPWKTIYYPRYTLVCLPAAAAMLGGAIASIPTLFARASAVALLVALPMLGGIKQGLCLNSAMFAPSPLKAAASAIQSAARPGDVIVIFPEFYATTFNWYYRGNMPEVCLPATGRVELVNWHTYAARVADPHAPARAVDCVRAHLRPGGTIWVLYNPSYHGRQSNIDYDDLLARFTRELDAAIPTGKQTHEEFFKGLRFDADGRPIGPHPGQRREGVMLTICTTRSN